jgi:hypothetical protein
MQIPPKVAAEPGENPGRLKPKGLPAMFVSRRYGRRSRKRSCLQAVEITSYGKKEEAENNLRQRFLKLLLPRQ